MVEIPLMKREPGGIIRLGPANPEKGSAQGAAHEDAWSAIQSTVMLYDERCFFPCGLPS
jgi:hypothetical protein